MQIRGQGEKVDDCIIYLSKALAIVHGDRLTVLKLARLYLSLIHI